MEEGWIHQRGIAELAGVSHSAVGKWRVRHREFPSVVSTEGGCNWFVRDEVEQFLANNPQLGKGREEVRGE